ncbi:ribonucleotide-diphosphate reductase subunit alpha [Verrucomicrobiota bacterium]|nr:ribonucleotide-diphosphate reductase subunit alpha [Verrucomicrobiota bacterium]
MVSWFPASNEPLSDFSMNALRRIFSLLSPVLALALVVGLFCALLAWKDVRDFQQQHEGVAFTEAFAKMRAQPDEAFTGLNSFITGGAWKKNLTQTAIVAVGALGMILILVSGGIDLSVGSSVAMCSVFVAKSLNTGSTPLTAAFIAILAGAAVGCVNGSLVAGLRQNPFIVTLGMMSVIRGLALWRSENQTVNLNGDIGESWLLNLLAVEEPGKFWPLPAGVWLAIALSVLVAVVMNRTVFGRRIFAIGSNEATARLCGIRVRWTQVAIYTLAGVLFGIAGALQFSRLTQGDPTGAPDLALDVIAAVVIGGASLNGGSGSVFGAVLGALLMTVLRNGATAMAWEDWTQRVIIGAVIIAAVALDRLRRKER